MTTAIVCAFSPVGTTTLKTVLQLGIKVLALYTYEQKSDELWFEPPELIARQHNIPVFKEPKFNADSVYERILSEKPDLLFSFYFREMIQERFLQIPRLGAYNMHGSLLPKYRGRAPINWVLVNGETMSGMTLHAMTPKPDDGDVIAQQQMALAWDETPLSLILRGAQIAADLVRQSLPGLIDGTAPRVKQSELGASTYFGGRAFADGRLDFSWTVARAFNMIRAVADPWPNAFIETDRGLLKISWALPSDACCSQGLQAGMFRSTPEGVLLGFADGAIRLHALCKGNVRSERPSDHALWLQELGICEYCCR